MSGSNPSGTSTNFFGTFLDTLSRDKSASNKGADPLTVDAILRHLLAGGGARALPDLMPVAGNSVGVLLESLEKLKSSGMIEQQDDRVSLTDRGRMLASLTR